MKTREPRADVAIAVRFVSAGGWANAEIRNVSSGGLMALPDPPLSTQLFEVQRILAGSPHG